jgi:hypothetical protein
MSSESRNIIGNDEIRMTNDEGMPHDEMCNSRSIKRAFFVIRASSLIRHWLLSIRHSSTGFLGSARNDDYALPFAQKEVR